MSDRALLYMIWLYALLIYAEQLFLKPDLSTFRIVMHVGLTCFVFIKTGIEIFKGKSE